MGLFSRSQRKKPQLSQLEATTRFLSDYAKRFTNVWPQVFEEDVRPIISETSARNPDLFNGPNGVGPTIFCYASIATELNAVRNIRSQEEAQHIEDLAKVALAWDAKTEKADGAQMDIITQVMERITRVLRGVESGEPIAVAGDRVIVSLSNSEARQIIANAPDHIVTAADQIQNLMTAMKEYGIKSGVLNDDNESVMNLGYAMFEMLDCVEWNVAPSIACVGLGAGVIRLTGGWWKSCFEKYEVAKE